MAVVLVATASIAQQPANEPNTWRLVVDPGGTAGFRLFDGGGVLRISSDQELRVRLFQDERLGLGGTIQQQRYPNPIQTESDSTTTWYRVFDETFVVWNFLPVETDSVYITNTAVGDSAHVWLEWK